MPPLKCCTIKQASITNVGVHTRVAKRAGETSMLVLRGMRIDSKTAWLSACRRVGVENFRFHDLWHTRASRLIPSDVPLSALQEMGGWESREMVRRYAHLAPNHLTEYMRKIDDILGDNVPLWNYRRNKKGVTD